MKQELCPLCKLDILLDIIVADLITMDESDLDELLKGQGFDPQEVVKVSRNLIFEVPGFEIKNLQV